MANKDVVREYVFDRELKYGANPHQKPSAVYSIQGTGKPFVVLNGTPGYINSLDALNAWQLVKEMKQATGLPAAASFKHTSPAGAAVAVPLTPKERQAYEVEGEFTPLAVAYLRARNADPMSSFGDFSAVSDEVDEQTANIIKPLVTDGIIAPSYTPKALEILKQKKNGAYIILQADPSYQAPELEFREVYGMVLSQKRNDAEINKQWLSEIITKNKELTEDAIRDLIVCSIAVKYTQSNSVGYALNGQVIGMGAGQQSRVDCAKLAGRKATTWWLQQHPKVLNLHFKKGTKRTDRINCKVGYIEGDMTPPEFEDFKTFMAEVPELLTDDERKDWMKTLHGVAMSSDAFFPFRDSIDQASRFGVSFIVQPCGSVADESVIAAANDYNMVMIKCPHRLFHH